MFLEVYFLVELLSTDQAFESSVAVICAFVSIHVGVVREGFSAYITGHVIFVRLRASRAIIDVRSCVSHVSPRSVALTSENIWKKVR